MGTLSRPNSSDTNKIPVQLVWELPNRLLLQERGGQGRAIAFDGQQPWKIGGSPDQSDMDLIESLTCDSAEHFLLAQAEGSAVRFLGSRFSPDDGQDPTGPFYEIYQVADLIQIEQQSRQQLKNYYFNSDTLLMEKVRYEVERFATMVSVEIQLGNWRTVDGQQAPGSIKRLEDGQAVLELIVQAATHSPRIDDRIFRKP